MPFPVVFTRWALIVHAVIPAHLVQASMLASFPPPNHKAASCAAPPVAFVGWKAVQAQ